MVGALLRYYLDLSINTVWIHHFPLSTLMINYIGAFILAIFTFSFSRYKLPEWLRLGFGTGLIGSFTTFSTFSSETIILLNEGHMMNAFLYIILSMVGGLLLPLFGYYLSIKKSGNRL